MCIGVVHALFSPYYIGNFIGNAKLMHSCNCYYKAFGELSRKMVVIVLVELVNANGNMVQINIV